MKYYNIEKIFKDFKLTNITNKEFNEASKKANFLGKLGKDFILLLNILKDYWNNKFYISKKDLAIIIGVILYVALPLDLIPDVPGPGYFDDITVVSIAMIKLRHLINDYKNRR